MDSIYYEINPDNRYKGVCKQIEDNMLQGKLAIYNTPGKAIRFSPKGTKANLPLRTTSSVVSEISPLYLLLKNRTEFPKISSIYYEEPEMCLHPKLQQVIASILIRLANAGIVLTATTHSDIIIQHVNNMIRLGLSDRCDELMSKYHYEKDDLIAREDVSMYQFNDNEDGSTSLEELPCGEYGFEVPAFNNALDHILEVVYELQEAK